MGKASKATGTHQKIAGTEMEACSYSSKYWLCIRRPAVANIMTTPTDSMFTAARPSGSTLAATHLAYACWDVKLKCVITYLHIISCYVS